MNEDILEQLVDDYLKHLGYFTQHNILYRPSASDPEFDPKKDSVPSDIDILAVHPRKRGSQRVVVVSCKAWVSGFNPATKAREVEKKLVRAGRDSSLGFRELAIPRWSRAFRDEVFARTGSRAFTYWTAVTKLTNASTRDMWERKPEFLEALKGNGIRLIELSEILSDLWESASSTPSSSDIGRSLRLIKFSSWRPKS